MPRWGWFILGAELAAVLAITAICAAAVAMVIVQLGQI